MSKILYQMIQNNKDNPHLEIMRKEVTWCDDYIEIKCIGIHSAKKFLFRLSAALISAMIQKYYFNLTELWKMLANSAQVYVDRVLFSIQHIQVFAQKKDSHNRDAYVVYKTTRHDEAGEPWNIEFFANLVEPFDLEVQVQLSQYFQRRHYYRIESFLLKSYFEKYCLEKYATPLITPEQSPKGIIDMSQYPREPNHMLEALAEEIIFDKEADEIYVKSIEVLRLEGYLEQANMKHHSEKAKQEHLDHQNSLRSSHNPSESPDARKDRNTSNNSPSHYRSRNAAVIHREGVTILSPNHPSSKKKSISMHSTSFDEDLLDVSSRLSIITDPQPPPLEKYTSLSALANNGLGIEKLRALSASHRQRHSDKLDEEEEDEENDDEELKDSEEYGNEASEGVDINRSRRIKLNAADALIRFENQRKKKLSPFEAFLLNYNSSPKRVKEIQQKINQIYQENYQAILGTIDEMHILMNRPLEAYKDHFQQQQSQLNSLSSVALLVSPPKSMNKSDALSVSRGVKMEKDEALSEEDMQRFIIKEALSIKSELRSTMTTKVIADFLRYKSELGKYLTHCSMDDIHAIANDCTVVEANETTVIDLLHIVQHDPIDNIYLLIEGNLTAKAIPYADEAAALLAAATATAINTPTSSNKTTSGSTPSSRKASANAKIPHHQKGRVETWKFYPGDIIGETIFTGGLIWEYTLQSPIPTVKEAKFQAISKSRRTLLYQPTLSRPSIHPSNQNNTKNQVFGVGTDSRINPPHNNNTTTTNTTTSTEKHYLLCKIPFITCQRYIGRAGPEVEEFLTYFWKSLRVYLEMKDYNDLIVQESLHNLRQKELHPLEYQLAQIKNQFYHHLTPINAIQSGRIRTYQAGVDIFTQGQLRHHMFIIKQGSATYYRLFPRDLIGEDIIPEKIETVCNRNYTGTLLSNDFSFFDSEDITIIDRMEELDGQFLNMISYSLEHQVALNQKHPEGESVTPIDPTSNNAKETEGGGERRSIGLGWIEPKTAKDHISSTDSSDSHPQGEASHQRRTKGKESDFLRPRSLFSESTDPHLPSETPLRLDLLDTQDQTDPEALDTEQKQRLLQQHYSNEKIFEYHQKKFHRFGHYQNSLTTNTRCEVCVVELSELVKSIPLLTKLLQLTNEKYPQLLISNEEIIYDYYREIFWSRDRKEYLERIQADRKSGKLNEAFYHDLMNNENDHRYYTRQPVVPIEKKEELGGIGRTKEDIRESHFEGRGKEGKISRPTTANNGLSRRTAGSRPTTAASIRQNKRESQSPTTSSDLVEEPPLPPPITATSEEDRQREAYIKQEMLEFQYPQRFQAILQGIEAQAKLSDDLQKELQAAEQQQTIRRVKPRPSSRSLAIKISSRSQSDRSPASSPRNLSSPRSAEDIEDIVEQVLEAKRSPRSTMIRNGRITHIQLSPRPQRATVVAMKPSDQSNNDEENDDRPLIPSKPSTAPPSHSRSTVLHHRTNHRSSNPPSSTSNTMDDVQPAMIKEAKPKSDSNEINQGSNHPRKPPLAPQATTSNDQKRRKAVDIHIQNIHDIRLISEQMRGTRPNSAASPILPGHSSDPSISSEKSPDRKASPSSGRPGLSMIDHLWQCHSPSTGKSRPHSRHRSPKKDGFNVDLLAPSQRQSPEDYVQLYRERLRVDPKQRFLEEFVYKNYN